jgi:adenylosuccinate lyase
MDTGAALRYKEFGLRVLLPDLINLIELLAQIARDEAETPQIGRTHGQHAEPITFGCSVALFVSRLGGRALKLEQMCHSLRGKFAGPVGAHNALSLAVGERALQFERDLLLKLKLEPSPTGISSQLTEQEPLVDLAYTAVSIMGILANFADDMRHLYRTEIGEIKEKFQPERVGSSTMPHKVNPKDFENVKSFWKAYMPRLTTVLMDQISEHQRDLTNSASGRFLAELFAAVDYSIYRTMNVVKQMEVNRKKMRENLDFSRDAMIAEPLYILLGLHGCPDPYDWSRKLVNASRQTGKKMTELVEAEPQLHPFYSKFTEKEKDLINHPEKYVGNSVTGTHQTCDYWMERCAEIRKRAMTV